MSLSTSLEEGYLTLSSEDENNHHPLRHSTSIVLPEKSNQKKRYLDLAVLEWLKYIGLEQYAENFMRNGYDNIKVCGHLDEHDIKALGMNNALPGHKKSLLVYSRELGELIDSQRDLRLKALMGEAFSREVLFAPTAHLEKEPAPMTRSGSSSGRKVSFAKGNKNSEELFQKKEEAKSLESLDTMSQGSPSKADKLESTFLKQSFLIRQEFTTWNDPETIVLPSEGGYEAPPRIHVVLARHGLSQANSQPELYTTMSDHAIPLAELGKTQAREAGIALRKYYEEKFGVEENQDDDMISEDANPSTPLRMQTVIEHNDNNNNTRHCRMWTSPYLRARQTAQIMMSAANEGGVNWITDLREHVLLAEQQFGLFEGTNWESDELQKSFPKELAYYRKAQKFGGRFWAKVPLGESRLDVAQRVHHSFGTFQRDAERFGIQKIVVVSHGLTMRAFMMMWLQQRPEWLEMEPNPTNCALRVIEENLTDSGYIHPRAPTEKQRPDLLLTKDDNFVSY